MLHWNRFAAMFWLLGLVATHPLTVTGQLISIHSIDAGGSGVVFVESGSDTNLYSVSPFDLLTNADFTWHPPVPDADGIGLTGLWTDLAIRGSGYFVVRDPETSQLFYTRFGKFRLDSNGYLVTDHGFRLQGLDQPDGATIGDLQIDDNSAPPTTLPGAAMTTFEFEGSGVIVVMMSDGSQFVRGRILLQSFDFPDELAPYEPKLFTATESAHPADSLAAPGENGLGQIVWQALDLTPVRPQLQSLANDNPHDPLRRGALTPTIGRVDYALKGEGAFVVRDPITSELFATRAGMFLVDSNGFIVTYDRKRLQSSWTPDCSSLCDTSIHLPPPATAIPGALMISFWIRADGFVQVHYSDGTELTAGRIAVFAFGHPERLYAIGLGQFAGVRAAQPLLVENLGGFSNQTPRIVGAKLELINVTPDLLARRRQLSFFPQGALVRSDSPTDMAIDGEGLFQVRNPRDGKIYVTRCGMFHLDAQGYLVTAHGLRVQGLCTASLDQLGDVQVDAQGVPRTTSANAIMVRVSVGADGNVNVHMSDATEFVRGRVLLQRFLESFQLRPIGDRLYGNLAAAQPIPLGDPGTIGLGYVVSSALELPAEPEHLQLPSHDGFRFLINGGVARRWIIQSSEDSRHWRRIGVMEPAGFQAEFCDQSGPSHRPRAYRVQAEYEFPQFNRPELTLSNSLTNQAAQTGRPRRHHH